MATLQWIQANPFAISFDNTLETWNAGHVNDILAIGTSIVVASDTGGAMNNLGALYAHGQGVAQDYGKAREWLQKAADAGNPDAMNALGALYANGQGVAQDYDKAREWFQKAADAGQHVR
jgi:TPR repeat protein